MALEFFRPGSGILHRFDPRAKLVTLVVLVLCFLIPVRLEISFAYAAALILAVGLLLGPSDLLKSIRAIAPLLAVILLLTPVLRRGGEILWAPFGWPYLTKDGLRETAVLMIRFSGISLAFFMIFRTIDPNDLILALRWYGLSFRAALVLVIALRFIPTLAEGYGNIRDAHALRGGAGKRTGFSRIIPVLTSILIMTVRGIPSLAMTLEARGFGRDNPRTEYAALIDGRKLVLHMGIACFLAAMIFSLPCIFP
jgi:energy-coupling factor transport system permease protein